MRSTWAKLTAGLNERDLALLSAYRAAALALPGTEERVHRTEVQYALARVFTSGYMKSHYLEIAVDLLREAQHPLLRAAFHTTKKVVTHRLTISDSDQLDASVRELLAEAHRTVGPGTR